MANPSLSQPSTNHYTVKEFQLLVKDCGPGRENHITDYQDEVP